MSRSAGASVHTDLWTRQLSNDSRLFYFNRCTGLSQWHVPNDLYKPRSCIAKSGSLGSLGLAGSSLLRNASAGSLRPQGVLPIRRVPRRSLGELMMPGIASATKRVSCVTECFLTQEEESASRRSRPVTPDSAASSTDARSRGPLETVNVLRVVMKSARGLLDTDFMPGVDKSDPYCMCEIDSRNGQALAFDQIDTNHDGVLTREEWDAAMGVTFSDSRKRTKVVFDNLNPVWDEEVTVSPYTPGMSLTFSIWDSDLSPESEVQWVCGVDTGDDFLGRVTVDVQDLFDAGGPKEYRLDDAGQGIDAFLTLEVSGPCASWPDLVGMDQTAACERLRAIRPDLSLECLELSTNRSTSGVVSWDPIIANKGYTANFFGAWEADMGVFCEGDLVEVYPCLRHMAKKGVATGVTTGNKRQSKIYSFSHVGGPATEHQKVGGKMVRYVYLKETLGSALKDGMQWRRLPRAAPTGYLPDRVCIYYNPRTDMVVSVPRCG